MIAALSTLVLSTPLTGGFPVQVPVEAQLPAALQGADVRATMQLSPTHFAARSHAAVEQWVVFENPTVGLRATRGLSPHGELVYPLGDPSAADGMSVALVTKDRSGHVVVTPSQPCANFAGTTVLFERTATGVDGWISRHEGRSLTRAAAAPHVPVPVPSENKNRSKRRKVEGKKLPPL